MLRGALLVETSLTREEEEEERFSFYRIETRSERRRDGITLT
jgi:hypothetical protein